MYDSILAQLQCVKETADQLMLLSNKTRNVVLLNLADVLRNDKACIRSNQSKKPLPIS